MPRQEQRQKEGRKLQTTSSSSPRVTEVNTRPVDTYVAPKTKQNQLLDALKVLNPAVQAYQNRVDADAYSAGQQSVKEIPLEEAAELVKKGDINPFQNPWYHKGAMQLYGQRMGRDAVRELNEKFTNEFNADTDDIETFLSEFSSKDIAGSQDRDFLTGYSPIMDQAVEAVRDQYQAFQTERVKAEVEQGLTERYDDIFRGGEVTPMDMQALSQDAEQFFDLSKKEAELIAFEAANRIGVEGKPEVYDVFYEKRADGSPGLAHTKVWGKKIELARQAAMAKQLANIKAQEDAEDDEADKIAEGLLQDWTKRISEGEDVRSDIMANTDKVPSEKLRSIFNFNLNYPKNAAEIVTNRPLYVNLMDMATSGEITNSELTQVFLTKGGLSLDDYTMLSGVISRKSKDAQRAFGQYSAQTANRSWLEGQYKVESQWVMPQDSATLNTLASNAKYEYVRKVSAYIHENPEFNPQSPEAHTQFRQFAEEAINNNKPPEDIFTKYGSNKELPTKYKGDDGFAKMVDDRDNNVITDEEYNTYFIMKQKGK